MTKARLQKSASGQAGSWEHASCPEVEIRKYAPMSIDMRKTGFDVVGDIPWGTHFCLFYEAKQDLLEIAVLQGTDIYVAPRVDLADVPLGEADIHGLGAGEHDVMGRRFGLIVVPCATR